MLKDRPIVSIAIGYIFGIIMGLYCKISIVFLYLFIFVMYLILRKPQTKEFKLISLKRYSRYLKILISKQVLIIIISSSIISNSITIYQNNKYNNLYKSLQEQEIEVNAIIISNPKEKDYKQTYKIKVEDINGNKKYKNTYLYLDVKKGLKSYFEYGDKINIIGEFKEPSVRRNYKGFNYKEYLKTQKIYGTINTEKVNSSYKNILILKYTNNIFLEIKKIIKENFNEDVANVLLGVFMGYTDEIDEEIKIDFQESNILYVLAVSGMHVGYLIIFMEVMLGKVLGKRTNRKITIIILSVYMCITGMSPSVVRATIMESLTIMSGIFYTKSDKWQNLSLAMLVLLMYNVFLIKSIGVLLSFGGTIGIIVLSKQINYIIKKQFGLKNIPNKVVNIIEVTLSATILVMPIIVIIFNKIYITSLIISMIIGAIIGIVFVIGIIFCIFYKVLEFMMLKEFVIQIIDVIVGLVIKLAEIGSNLPLNSIYVTTPNIFIVILYYIIVFIRIFFIFSLSREKSKCFSN